MDFSVLFCLFLFNTLATYCWVWNSNVGDGIAKRKFYVELSIGLWTPTLNTHITYCSADESVCLGFGQASLNVRSGKTDISTLDNINFFLVFDSATQGCFKNLPSLFFFAFPSEHNRYLVLAQLRLHTKCNGTIKVLLYTGDKKDIEVI